MKIHSEKKYESMKRKEPQGDELNLEDVTQME